MINLSDKWTWLNSEPETGMGYQIASILLKDGTRFDQAVIIGGTISSIRGRREIRFTEDDIAEIIVTHDKWDWSKDKPE